MVFYYRPADGWDEVQNPHKSSQSSESATQAEYQVSYAADDPQTLPSQSLPAPNEQSYTVSRQHAVREQATPSHHTTSQQPTEDTRDPSYHPERSYVSAPTLHYQAESSLQSQQQASTSTSVQQLRSREQPEQSPHVSYQESRGISQPTMPTLYRAPAESSSTLLRSHEVVSESPASPDTVCDDVEEGRISRTASYPSSSPPDTAEPPETLSDYSIPCSPEQTDKEAQLDEPPQSVADIAPQAPISVTDIPQQGSSSEADTLRQGPAFVTDAPQPQDQPSVDTQSHSTSSSPKLVIDEDKDSSSTSSGNNKRFRITDLSTAGSFQVSGQAL